MVELEEHAVKNASFIERQAEIPSNQVQNQVIKKRGKSGSEKKKRRKRKEKDGEKFFSVLFCTFQ